MQIFEEAARRKLVGQLEETLRARHPDLVAERGPEALRTDISAAIASATRFRIEYEVHVYQFTVMFLALGPDFEKRPDTRWAVDILKSELPPETRLFQLRETYLSRQGDPSP